MLSNSTHFDAEINEYNHCSILGASYPCDLLRITRHILHLVKI